MEQTIQPGEQVWVNLAELFRNRVPDRPPVKKISGQRGRVSSHRLKNLEGR
jgi:hypothetical protein